MSKKLYLMLLLLFLPIITYSCKDEITTPNDDKPGRRDYVWTVDSVDYGSLNGGIYFQYMWGSATNDVWGTGFTPDVRNCIWHYNGIKWERAYKETPIPAGYGSPIVGCVWGSSFNDVWAFGARYFSYPDTTESFIMHYDGIKWSELPGNKNNMPNGFFSFCAIEKDDFWIGLDDCVYHYYKGQWRRINIGLKHDNRIYPVQSICAVNKNIYIMTYPVGVDSLYLMKYENDKFVMVDTTRLFTEGKFGSNGFEYSGSNVFTVNMQGIYSAQVNNGIIQKDTWHQVVKTYSGFYNSFKISSKDIWVIGPNKNPYHFNGVDWREIEIPNHNSNSILCGTWGNGKEIFICDYENGIIYHGK